MNLFIATTMKKATLKGFNKTYIVCAWQAYMYTNQTAGILKFERKQNYPAIRKGKTKQTPKRQSKTGVSKLGNRCRKIKEFSSTETSR